MEIDEPVSIWSEVSLRRIYELTVIILARYIKNGNQIYKTTKNLVFFFISKIEAV